MQIADFPMALLVLMPCSPSTKVPYHGLYMEGSGELRRAEPPGWKQCGSPRACWRRKRDVFSASLTQKPVTKQGLRSSSQPPLHRSTLILLSQPLVARALAGPQRPPLPQAIASNRSDRTCRCDLQIHTAVPRCAPFCRKRSRNWLVNAGLCLWRDRRAAAGEFLAVSWWEGTGWICILITGMGAAQGLPLSPKDNWQVAVMVFSLSTPAAQSYLLWHRFTMPTASGTHDAVAVPAYVGNQLVSAYTFLLEHIVLFLWAIVVLVAVLVSIWRDGHDHPRSPLHKEIFSRRSSPMGTLQLTAKAFLQTKSTRWFVSLWIAIALACVTVKYAVPIIFARYILLGNGAPVNPSAIFVPSRNNTGGFSDSSNKDNLKIFDFYVPSALRAVGSIDSLNGTDGISPSLSVDQPETIGVDESGGLILRIGYRYNVTGLDFGLQDYPDLVLSVEGSCTTEYNWWAGETSDDAFYPGAYVEEYLPFNNPDDSQFVSLYDGGPRAFFFANPPDISPTNSTWAAIISSVNRTSWFPSTDPWYQTTPNPFYNSSEMTIAPYMVASQRPALSCWENDVWSYQGHTASVVDLPHLPGVNLPIGLTTIFVDSVGLPMIYLLGTYLQVSALKSSVSALSNILDASSSSIYGDLERLVFASYIATVNCLTETTLFSPSDGFLNDAAPGGVLLPGAEKFVIYSDDIATLSVRTLIIIPVLVVALWIASTAFFLFPVTGEKLRSLKPSGEETEEKGTKSRLSKMAVGMAGVVFGEAASFAKSETGDQYEIK